MRRANPEVERWSRVWALAWALVAVAVLLAPIFAHGCHGDDVDHEPGFFPLKLFDEE